MAPPRQRKVGLEEVLELFQKGDANGDGTMDRDEFVAVLRHLLGKTFKEGSVDLMLRAADANHDGKVSFEEFLGWLWGDDEARMASRPAAPVLGDVSEMEALTEELARDLYLLEQLLLAYDDEARENLRIDVPKPPPQEYKAWLGSDFLGDRGAEEQYKQYCADYWSDGDMHLVHFSSQNGGWKAVEDLQSSAADLLQFLQDGGPLPTDLATQLLGRRSMTTNWKSAAAHLRGGFLTTKAKHGRGVEAVFQLLKAKDGLHVSVRRLKSLGSASQQVKALAVSDQSSDGWQVTFKDAVPILDLISPAVLAARAAELSAQIDELCDVLQRYRPAGLQEVLPTSSCRRSLKVSKRLDATKESLEEDAEKTVESEQGPSEMEIVTAALQANADSLGTFLDSMPSEERLSFMVLAVETPQDYNDWLGGQERKFAEEKDDLDYQLHLARCAGKVKRPLDEVKDGWSGLEALHASATQLLKFLHSGGTLPCDLAPAMLGKRNLKANWKNCIHQLRGGYLLNKGKGGRQKVAVFQLLAIKDARTVTARRLPQICCAGPAIRSLGTGPTGTSEDIFELPVNEAVPLLDLISAAPLVASAAQLTERMDEWREILGLGKAPAATQETEVEDGHGEDGEEAGDEEKKEVLGRQGKENGAEIERGGKESGEKDMENEDA